MIYLGECKLKKNEYSTIVGYNVLLMFIWASWLKVFSSIPLLILCLGLPITMRWMLKSPIIILDLFVLSNFALWILKILLSIYILVVAFSWWTNFFCYYILSLYPWQFFFVLKVSRFQFWFNRYQDFFLINVLMKKYIGSHDFFLKQTTSLNFKWFSYSQLILGLLKNYSVNL